MSETSRIRSLSSLLRNNVRPTHSIHIIYIVSDMYWLWVLLSYRVFKAARALRAYIDHLHVRVSERLTD